MSRRKKHICLTIRTWSDKMLGVTNKYWYILFWDGCLRQKQVLPDNKKTGIINAGNAWKPSGPVKLTKPE